MIKVPHSSGAFDSKRAPAAPTLTGIPPVIVPTPVVAFAEFALAGIDPSSREPARPGGWPRPGLSLPTRGSTTCSARRSTAGVEDAAVREVVEDPIAVGQSGINNGAPDSRHSRTAKVVVRPGRWVIMTVPRSWPPNWPRCARVP